MADSAEKSLVSRNEGLLAEPAPNKIALGSLQQLDITGLSNDQITQLRQKHAEGMISLNHKGLEMQADVGATSATLHTLATSVRQVSEGGDAVTITHVQKNSVGHTEIIMGNTEAAHKGKLSRASRGEKDQTLLYVIIAAVVAIVIGVAIAYGGR